MRVECAKVYSESDYSLFKRLEGNRDVLKYRKNKIISSINEVGYILNPNIVNSKMEIIDGQGRFEACKELGLPIVYVVDDKAGIKECVAMNMRQTNWRTLDWLQMYAELGNQNYTRLLSLQNAYRQLPMDTIYGAARNKILKGSSSKYLISGKLTFTETDYYNAKAAIEDYLDINAIVDSIPGNYRSKSTGTIWMLRFDGVDKARLKKIFREKHPVINPVVDGRVDLFLSQMSDLYNKGLHKGFVYFDAEYKRQLMEEN